jgi:hypothetical protein
MSDDAREVRLFLTADQFDALTNLVNEAVSERRGRRVEPTPDEQRAVEAVYEAGEDFS